MRKGPINILLVQDNEEVILLNSKALAESKVSTDLHVIRDENEALNFLRNQIYKAPNSLPDLFLLDIDLPKKTGHEVLESVKNHPDLKHIPVIMLTTSFADDHVLRAYQEHAEFYGVKPLEVNDFLNVISKIEEFWLSIARLPKN